MRLLLMLRVVQSPVSTAADASDFIFGSGQGSPDLLGSFQGRLPAMVGAATGFSMGPDLQGEVPRDVLPLPPGAAFDAALLGAPAAMLAAWQRRQMRRRHLHLE